LNNRTSIPVGSGIYKTYTHDREKARKSRISADVYSVYEDKHVVLTTQHITKTKEEIEVSHQIGMDLGKSHIKYQAATGIGEIPAWLSRGRITQVIGRNSGAGGISYQGQDYIVGRDAILGSGFSWSATETKDDLRNLVFALYVLGSLGVSEADMVIGLPVSAASSPAAVERIKSLLNGTHEVIINDRPSSITIRAGVLAEPLGTYFSLCLDVEGRPVSSTYFNELIGIADIGYRTLDIITIEEGKLSTIGKDSTLSGIAVLFNRVCKVLETDHGMLRPHEIEKVHTWLTGGCQEPIKFGGAPVRSDLPTEVARFRAEFAGQIMDEVQSLLSGIRPDRIVMTGGGAALLRSDLSKINPNLTFHPNPRYANAIGFYRAAVARSRRA
jgi:hypothetical protein